MKTLNSNSDDLDPDNVPTVDVEIKTNPTRPRISRYYRLLTVLILVLGVVALGVWFLISEAQKVPDFYAAVLAVDEDSAEKYGKQFERNLVRLQNSARMRKPWMVKITQDQINGWFASDLPEKFSESVPVEILDPRVVFNREEVKLAFKYRGTGISGIVVITADIFCTDLPNEIGVEVKDVRTGVVPLPIGPWIEKVADSIRQAGIPLYWSNVGAAPIGVFTIPEYLSSRGDDRRVVIEAIDLHPGKLVIAGRTENLTTPGHASSNEQQSAENGNDHSPHNQAVKGNDVRTKKRTEKVTPPRPASKQDAPQSRAKQNSNN